MKPNPRFIQGTFTFEGQGLETPIPMADECRYLVPPDKRAQLIYMRAGNSTGELVSLLLTRDGKPMRYFPLGAKASLHVSLAVVEDIFPESQLELLVAAPKGVAGAVVVDFGLVEVD